MNQQHVIAMADQVRTAMRRQAEKIVADKGAEALAAKLFHELGVISALQCHMCADFALLSFLEMFSENPEVVAAIDTITNGTLRPCPTPPT